MSYSHFFPFFVIMDKNIKKPEGSFISYFSNLVKAQGGINLAQGIPGFQPPEELLQSLKTITHSNIHQYAPGIGNFKLLELINNQYSSCYSVERDNFLVVQGATEALSLVYIYLNQKINDRFTTLSFEPAYESYSQLPKIFGQHYIDFPLNFDQSIDLDLFTKTVKSERVKVVFMASPGNPYGKVWKQAEVEKLIELAQNLGFYLIFDGVYKDIYFNNRPYLLLAHSSPNVFYVNSFSKMLCITGWRVGYLYSHFSHVKDIRAIHDYIGLCAPSVMQEALANYLQDYSYGNQFVEKFRGRVQQNFNTLSSALTQLKFTIPAIDGGCFIWAKLPEPYIDGFDFAVNLYNCKKVATIPGEHFSKNFKNWIRLNLARSEGEIDQAVKHLTNYLANG